MHYALEIIMPPVVDVKAAVEGILKPFDENEEEASHAFWDWWVIGGRYSGKKTEATISPDKMAAFMAELERREVTVSPVRFGKQELRPASQIEMVDALWREMCPGAGAVCPVFAHSGESADTDVCAYRDMPPALTAYKVIVAAPDYKGEKLEAVTMFSKELWNGVTHEETKWDGVVATAIAMHLKNLSHHAKGYAARATPQPDWLVVTVDYHS